VMLLIFLFISLALIDGNNFNKNFDNVYTLAAIMKSPPYVISHSCFLFCTLLFLGEGGGALLISASSFVFQKFDSFYMNFVFVTLHCIALHCIALHALNGFPVFSKFEMKNYLQFCLCM
jgi:hypothetical protein